jgi:hypothetical protein
MQGGNRRGSVSARTCARKEKFIRRCSRTLGASLLSWLYVSIEPSSSSSWSSWWWWWWWWWRLCLGTDGVGIASCFRPAGAGATPSRGKGSEPAGAREDPRGANLRSRPSSPREASAPTAAVRFSLARSHNPSRRDTRRALPCPQRRTAAAARGSLSSQAAAGRPDRPLCRRRGPLLRPKPGGERDGRTGRPASCEEEKRAVRRAS